jgi:hypothetical protein
MIKQWTFEDLPAPDIDLDLTYSYYYDPGKTSGPIDMCWPPEEDSELELPTNFEQTVKDAYAKAALDAIAMIEDRVEEMLDDNKPREWAEEERDDYELDRAISREEDRKERLVYGD